MESELNLPTIFINFTNSDTLSYSSSLPANTTLPMSVLMFLITAFVILIGAFVRHKKLARLAGKLDFSAKNSTRIPSVSLLMILKCVYKYGAELQKIIDMGVEKYGEIFQLNLPGSFNMVLVTNPCMVQKIWMSSKPEHLYKPKAYDLFCFGEFKDGLLSSPVEIWKPHRSAVSKAFTYKGLLRQLNIFEEHAKRFILNLQDAIVLTPNVSKQMIPIEKLVDKITFEIISHVAAGQQVLDLTNEENSRFHANFERMKELMSYRISNFINAVDFIWNLNPMKKELHRIQDDIVCYWTKILSAMPKNFDADATDDDMAGKSLVELMIKAEFSDKETFTELSTFLFGGYETTSSTAKLLLFLLASHKEYQDKCREEVDMMFDQMRVSNSNEIAMEAINSLTFLDLCIKECLRLYPLVPIFGRRLESSLQLDDHTCLPSGTNVFTSTWIIHRNPKIYPEPEKFDPERFLPENVKNRSLGEYIPFSLGPRNCIGYKSATIELKVLMAYVLHHFEVHSEMTVVKLDRLVKKSWWPLPDLGIKISPRQ